MKIEFERSGGVAGMVLRLAVDTEKLDEDEARLLVELVERADFFALPSRVPGGGGADRFGYEITVEAGERRHSVTTSDAAAPEPLVPLLDRLTRMARGRGGGGGGG